MDTKLTTLLAVLGIISSSVVNADSDIIRFANDEGGDRIERQEILTQNMDLILNEYLYEIQPQTSKMLFRVDSPIGEVWASFQDFEGVFAIMLNSAAQDDPTSININAESLDSDGVFIEAMLRSESFFDVENFPSMHFTGSSFEWFSDRHAVLKGYMTIKNVTRPVAFYVELVNVNVENRYSERITVKATTTIRRSEFGIYTLLPAVSDNVNLIMSIDALKKDTAISMID